MAEPQPRPVLITGAGRRIGLALAHHFLNQQQPVIVSYRQHYPSIDTLREAGAVCLQADFSSDDGILTFAEAGEGAARLLRLFVTPVIGWRKTRCAVIHGDIADDRFTSTPLSA